MAKLLRNATERGHLAIGMGDFNMLPLSLAHQLIETHGGVKDVWRVAHPDSSVGAAVDEAEKSRGRPIPTVGQSISEDGATCDTRLNTWRWDEEMRKRQRRGEKVRVDEGEPDPRAKRLDYVFVGQGTRMGNEASRWMLEDARVGMTERHPRLGCSLSDHFSVEATICRATIGQQRPPNGETKAHPLPLAEPESPYLPTSTYITILSMIHKYVKRERRQRRWRLAHFLGSTAVSIACFVAVWWSPSNYVSFLLMLASTLGLSAGVIDGLIGGLFVSSELRALKEFQWEIENAMALAAEVGKEEEVVVMGGT